MNKSGKNSSSVAALAAIYPQLYLTPGKAMKEPVKAQRSMKTEPTEE